MSVPKAAETLALGIDLRSSSRYPTGLALLDSECRLILLETIRTDTQIIAAIANCRPTIIAIDAPLGLPEGRCCTEISCECAKYGIMRESDRACAAAGFRPFPTLLPSMVGLTLRGIALSTLMLQAGERVIEVYPGMAQDVLNIPRKSAGIRELSRGLKRIGVKGLPRKRPVTHDELDAVTCALVGLLHHDNRTEIMGPPAPAPLVLPQRPPHSLKLHREHLPSQKL